MYMDEKEDKDKREKKEKEKKEDPDCLNSLDPEMSVNHEDKLKVVWSPENENIMVEWCDVAQCYKWLNHRSHAMYSRMHAWYTIPAIILSTISGTASFAQTSLPLQYQTYSPLVIGSINIFIGILTTIQQYLKISELNEAHRVSSIAWDKFARNIRIELSKHPDERTDAKTFIKICRQEFDRLMETSPDIKEKIIQEFNGKFCGKEGSKKRKRFEQLRKPDICDTIISANETRHKWYKELENVNLDEDDEALLEKEQLIEKQKYELENKEKELQAFTDLEKQKMDKQIEELVTTQKLKQESSRFYEEQCNLINKYITTFRELYERKPLKEEIIENIADNVEKTILDDFLETYDNEMV